MSPAAFLALLAAACAGACDAEDRTFSDPAEIADMVAKGWIPPMPEEAREVRVAWDRDLDTAFFCGEAPWQAVLGPAGTVEDAAAPAERPGDAPDWWWRKAALGTEAVRVPGSAGRGWTLMRIGPATFCGANLEAWRGEL